MRQVYKCQIFDTVPAGVTYQNWIAFRKAWQECPPGKWAEVTLLDNTPRENVMNSLREYLYTHARGQGKILSDRTDERVFWIHKKG